MEEPSTTKSVYDWITKSEKPTAPNGTSPAVSLVDLFCGCGGLTLGVWEAARVAGRQLKIRLAIDIAGLPLAVYRHNHKSDGWRVRQEDICRVFDGDLGAHSTSTECYWRDRVGGLDLLVAGPPCQGHSDLNNATRRQDPRNRLYLRVVRAAEVLQPKAVIIENVPAAVHDRGNVVDQSIRHLSSMGFAISASVLQVSSLGVPQQRKRHVLVATRTWPFQFAELCTNSEIPTVGQFLTGLEDEPLSCQNPFFQPSRMSANNRERVKYLFDRGVFDLPDQLRPPCHREKTHSYVSMYGRLHWDKPAQTITSGFGSMGQGRFVHPTRPRTLTPHEAARIQGFPDFFDFSKTTGVGALREMIGNAVPPQLSTTIVSKLIKDRAI